MEDIARTHEKSYFTQRVYKTGIRPVYIYHISSSACFLALWVMAARWDESDLDCMPILQILVTESPPIRGWGLPNFHRQDRDGHEVPESVLSCRPSHFAAANISRLHQLYEVLGSMD